VTFQAFDFIARLKKLKKFIYVDGHLLNEFRKEIPRQIASRMPWIEIVHAHNTSSCIHGDPRKNLDVVPYTLNDCGVFQLKEMFVRGAPNSQASFPNLQYLYMIGPLDNIEFFDKFASYSTISELTLENVQVTYVYQLLKITGQRLQLLVIRDLSDQIDLALLFTWCPNLIWIFIDTHHVTFSPNCSTLSRHLNRHLRHFYITFKQHNRTISETELIKFVFEAPLIEIIEIHYSFLELSDVEMIMNLDKSKLQHLRLLELHDIQMRSLNAQKIVFDLQKSVIVKAPRLKVIEVYLENERFPSTVKHNDFCYFYGLWRHLNC
jgi:hypothetical protein